MVSASKESEANQLTAETEEIGATSVVSENPISSSSAPSHSGHGYGNRRLEKVGRRHASTSDRSSQSV